MVKLILVRQTWSHMSSVSGYDPLFEIIQKKMGDTAISVFVSTAPYLRKISYIEKILYKLGIKKRRYFKLNGPAPSISRQNEITSSIVIDYATNHPEALIVLSVSENQFGDIFASASNEIKRRIVLNFHQPPAFLRLHWKDFSVLNSVRSLITLSIKCKEYLITKCNKPVYFINHGVNTNYFCPSNTSDNRSFHRLLFVGDWLRDIDTLTESMKIIWSKRSDIEINCVIPFSKRKDPKLYDLAQDPRVNWFADITVDSLRDLYRSSTLLFLPLKDATANNAILEAISCGLPVVTSDFGGVRDYVSEEIAVFCEKGNPLDHANKTLALLSNHDEIRKRGEKARKYAVNYLDWEIISNRYLELLDVN